MLRLALLLLLCSWMIGCGSNPPPPPAAAQGNPSSSTGDGTAAGSDADSQTNAVPSTLAVFELSPGGRDPFFPNSTRIAAAMPDNVESQAKPQLPLSSYLRLTAHRPSSVRPLAAINDTLFEPGEEGTVEVVIASEQGTNETHIVKIQCLEIRDDSVLIRVEGEPGFKSLAMNPQP